MKTALLLLILALTATPALSHEVITMGSDEWLPYVGTQTNRGYMIEVADAIFREKGIEVQIKQFPWARILTMVRKGELTAAPGMQRHQAPDFIIPAEPLGVDEAAFFLRTSDTWSYRGVKSLEGKRLGVIKNYTYESQLDRYISDNFSNGNKIHVAYGDDPYQQIVRVLRTRRVDMVVANPNVFLYTLRTMGLDSRDFRKIPIPNSARYVYIGFSPASDTAGEYAKTLSDGIVRMRKNGELDKILRKYSLKDWK